MNILVYVLLLYSYDSMPPLPDLSKIQLSEPPFWREPQESEVLINGFAGPFYGADLMLDLRSFFFWGGFEHKDEWDELETGNAQCSYQIALPHLWLKPQLLVQLMSRDVGYGHITPGMQFTVFTPVAIATGMFDYSLWKIADDLASEGAGQISCTFDRISYMPQLIISGIYTDKRLKPALYAQIHIHRFHFMLGSTTIQEPLSPHIAISYKALRTEVLTDIKTGVQHRTLREYFDPEIPIKYSAELPADTLRIGINLGLRIRMNNHTLTLEGSYNDWLSRINTGPDFVISTTREVTGINIGLTMQNNLRVGILKLYHTLHVQYDNIGRAIVFIPDYYVSDTLGIILGRFELSGDVYYASERSGLQKTLPGYGTANTMAGVRLSFLKLYLTLKNITDTKSELYDGYFLKGRQYAGGLEVSQRF